MKKIFSRPSILPDRTNHYDEHGHKIGYSRTSLLGTYTNHYDEYGHKVGRSRQGLFGTIHYDESGHRIGKSHESILGYQNHYDRYPEPLEIQEYLRKPETVVICQKLTIISVIVNEKIWPAIRNVLQELDDSELPF